MLSVCVRQGWARWRVGRAHGTTVLTVRRGQWDPRVESDMRVAMDQRAVAKARIIKGIRYTEDLPLRQRVIAESHVASCAGDVKPVAGRKKLPLIVNQ